LFEPRIIVSPFSFVASSSSSANSTFSTSSKAAAAASSRGSSNHLSFAAPSLVLRATLPTDVLNLFGRSFQSRSYQLSSDNGTKKSISGNDDPGDTENKNSTRMMAIGDDDDTQSGGGGGGGGVASWGSGGRRRGAESLPSSALSMNWTQVAFFFSSSFCHSHVTIPCWLRVCLQREVVVALSF
jgi:hypothetical protein